MTGPETIAAMREKQADTILAFSCGKDAIAAWLAMRGIFEKIVPYYLYLIPGLEFIDESICYYERFFETKIIRLPHPSCHRMLNNLVFQAPENCLVIEQAMLPSHTYEDVRSAVVGISGVDEKTYVADGVRAADSPIRRVSFATHGPISHNQKKFHPVWDMKKADLVSLFRKFSVKLPVDYQLFGRSFDGLDLRFLLPIKKHLPADYRRILEFFPLAELEIFRWEKSRG